MMVNVISPEVMETRQSAVSLTNFKYLMYNLTCSPSVKQLLLFQTSATCHVDRTRIFVLVELCHHIGSSCGLQVHKNTVE